MLKLLVLIAISATPLSALRRSKTEKVEGADEAVLKKADTDSDGKASYSESASVVNQIDDVDHETAMSALEKDFRDADGNADGLMNGNELASLPAAFPDELRNLIDDEKESLNEDEEVALTEVVEEVEHKLHPDHDDKEQTHHAVAETLGVDDYELENAIHGHLSKKRKGEPKKNEETKEDEEDEEVALLEVVQEAELKLHPDQDPKQTLHAFAETIGVTDNELENAIHSDRPTRRRRKQKKDEETNEEEETEKAIQEEKQNKKEESEKEEAERKKEDEERTEKEKEEREKEKAERKKEKEERKKKEQEEREKENEEKEDKEDKEEKKNEEDKEDKEKKDDKNI